jgi:GDP-4-dehydro-6-deoxy-D-mannose reductase
MSVLVTGAQGFAGRYLVAAWLAADPDVRIIGVGRSRPLADTFTHSVTRANSPIAAPLPAALRDAWPSTRYRYHQLDLLDAGGVAQVLADEEVHTVVHLAGSLRDEPLVSLTRNNVHATEALLRGAAQSGRPRVRVVVGSSGSVYGRVPAARLPIRESMPPAPIDLYAVTKRAAEDIAWIHHGRDGVEVLVARIFNIVGAGQDERHLCGALARQFGDRTAASGRAITVGPLDTTRDLVDVRDVASALIVLATAPAAHGTYNVATGRETPTQQVYDVLAALAGQAHAAVSRREARPVDFLRQCADISRLRGLGFAPRWSLRDSLSDLLRYYVEDVVAAGEEVRP